MSTIAQNTATARTFGFERVDFEAVSIIRATNGPFVINFAITETGLRYTGAGSNVTIDWAGIPALALRAARFHRHSLDNIL